MRHLSGEVSETLADADAWLIIKHGLYYKPGSHGYTGVRDLAGRFSKREAEYHANANDEIRIVPLLEADEFSKSCWDDVARDHLTKQRAAKDAEISSLRAQLDEAKADHRTAIDHLLARTHLVNRKTEEIDLLQAALDDARRKAIEECAAIADRWTSPEQRLHGHGGPATEMRALVSENQK